MKGLKPKFLNFYSLVNNFWPIIVITILVILFFWKFFLKGLVPIPADFIVGVYYPWLDYKWGNYITNVPVKNPLLADVPSLIYPVRLYAIELIKKGQWPLWDSLQFGGYPLLATFQSAALYPLNVIYLFFSNALAWSLEVILQPFFASIFMYFFLKNLKLSKFSSVFGSIVFAFSGFILIWLEYNVHGHVAMFLPLILLSIDKILKKSKNYWGIILSLSVAFQILAGYPQIVAYTYILSFFWFIFRADKRVSSFQFYGFKIITFIFWGILIASVQLFPGFELLSLSQRVKEGVSGGFGIAFLPWEGLIGLLAPDFFGNPTTGNYWGRWGWAGYANVNIFSGIVAFILASFAAMNVKRDKIISFFLLTFIFSLLFALPTPLTTKIFSFEYLGLKSAAATRILIITNFSLAVLSSFGFQYINKKKFRYLIRSTYIPWVILLATFLSFFTIKLLLTKKSENLGLELDSLEIIKNLNVGTRNLYFPLFLTLLITLAFFLVNKKKTLVKLVKTFLFLLMTFELFRFGWKFTPFSEKEFLYPPTKVLEFIQNKEKPFRINGGDVIPISMWMPLGVESFSGYDAVYPSRVAKFIAVANSGDLDATPMGRFGQLEGYNSNLFDLTNTKYIFALKRDINGVPNENGEISKSFSHDKFQIIFEDKTVAVLENKDVIDRAFFVTKWESVDSGESSLKELIGLGKSYDEKIIIEEPFDFFPQFSENNANVRYVQYEEQRSSLEVETENPGFLFVSDTMYPGWKVYVDGKEERIYLSNYIFRAVPLEKGKHEVVFQYEPKLFNKGMYITYFSSISLCVYAFYIWYLGKREKLKYTSRKDWKIKHDK